MANKIFLTHLINPLSTHEAQFIKNGAIHVSEDGKILDIGEKVSLLEKFPKTETVDYSKFLLIPPFYDLHFHWVQDDVRMKPKESLLDWLSHHTWPSEALFKDEEYSLKKAKIFATELLKNGTLGGAIFSSLHPHTVDHALQCFKGDFICGNPLMTMNSPDYLTHTKEEAKKGVDRLKAKYQRRYVFTPRFAITTDPETMKYGHDQFVKNSFFIQSHLSETEGEIDFVLKIFKDIPGFADVETYTEIYDKVGLLSPRTLMAHGIHLKDSELNILKKRDVVLVHCPTSNAPVGELGLGSGLFDFRRIDQAKIRWALGSDIGGGPYLSMFDVMNSFVSQNHLIKNFSATYVQALYKATVQGAKIISEKNSLLAPGLPASFSFIDMPQKGGNTSEEILKNLMLERKDSREQFSHLVASTYYQGVKHYDRL